MDFGSSGKVLAADVDDGIAEEDLEALDSDEEYEDDPDALFADREEDSDSKYSKIPFIEHLLIRIRRQSPCIYCLCTPCYLRISKCAFSSHRPKVIVLL